MVHPHLTVQHGGWCVPSGPTPSWESFSEDFAKAKGLTPRKTGKGVRAQETFISGRCQVKQWR